MESHRRSCDTLVFSIPKGEEWTKTPLRFFPWTRILQAKVHKMLLCVHVCCLVRLFVTPWTVACSSRLSMGLCPRNFPGKNTGVGCHILLQEIFPTQGFNTRILSLLHWQADSLPLYHLGSPKCYHLLSKKKKKNYYKPSRESRTLIADIFRVCASSQISQSLICLFHGHLSWVLFFHILSLKKKKLRYKKYLTEVFFCVCFFHESFKSYIAINMVLNL